MHTREQNNSSGTGPRLLRRPEVESRVGLKRSTIYRLMDAGEFPRPVQITRVAVGWVEAEIDEWITRRVAASHRR